VANCNGSQYNNQVTWASPAYQSGAEYEMDATVNGSKWSDAAELLSVCVSGYFVAVPPTTAAPAPLPNAGSTCSACKTGVVSVGHPIDPGSGNEFESALDFLAGDSRFRFTRVYNSSSVVPSSLGGHWQDNFSASIGNAYGAYQSSGAIDGYVSDVYATPSDACTIGWLRIAVASATLAPATAGATASFNTATNTCQLSTGQSIPVYSTTSTGLDVLSATTANPAPVAVNRPDGAVYIFQCSNGTCIPNSDVPLQLTPNANGYTLVDENGDTETYNNSGALVSTSDKSGYQQTLGYSGSGILATVTDNHGRVMRFGYNTNGNLATVTQPDGGVIQYGYDSDRRLATVTYPDNSVKTYKYGDASSMSVLMTGVVDESNNLYASFTYDGEGRANGDSLAGGVDAVAIIYNADGSAQITDALGSVRTYQYQVLQGRNRISMVQGPPCYGCGINAASTYDANGYLASVKDWDNNEADYAFDSTGLLDTLVEGKGTPVQRTTQTTWDAVHRVPTARTISDANNAVVSQTQWQLNTRGQVLARCKIDPQVSYTCANTGTVPAGVRRWTYTYCDAVDTTQCPLVGLPLSATGPRTDLTQTTHYSYYLTSSATNCGTPGGACYQVGDLYQVTDALGHVTTVASYDGAGRVTRITDANGVNTDMTYTLRGWLNTRSIGGATTTIGYTPYGAVHTITDPDGYVTTYGYDNAHRLTDIFDAQNNDLHYTLNAAGEKTGETITTASGTPTKSLTKNYNALGQLTTIVDGLNTTIFHADYSDSYDTNGNLTHSADAVGIQREQSYDALNRLKATIDNYNGTDTATQNTLTSVTQDALDRVTSVTDPDNLTTQYTYDGLGNLTVLQSPDSGTSGGANGDLHDAAGNLTQHTDARGVVTQYTYDALNRLTGKIYPAHPNLNVTYTYDQASPINGCPANFNIGHLTGMTDASGSTAWCYTNQGDIREVRQVINNVTYLHGYAYTAGRRLLYLQYPSGFELKYGFDTDGRVDTIGYVQQPGPYGSYTNSTLTPLITAVSHAPFGPVTGYSWAQGGQYVQRTYDLNYALTDIVSNVLNLHFQRDVEGRIGAEGTAPGANPISESYQYDPLNRLKELDGGTGSLEQAYTYNPTGDRLSKTLAGLGTFDYGYQTGTHRLITVGGTVRTPDADGNTTAMTDPNGDLIGLDYDDRNLLTTVTRAGSVIGNYQYNGQGVRVWRTITSPVIGQAATVYDPAGTGNLYGEYFASDYREYVYLDGIPVAAATDAGRAAPGITYLFADQLGTVRAISSPQGAGSYEWPWLNNAFGELPKTGTGNFYTRFPGQYYDVETGLHYNGNRYYDPSTGRYLQSDPIGLWGGVSTYVYVENNPLKSVDPLGLINPDQPSPITALEEAIIEGNVDQVEMLAEAAGEDPAVALKQAAKNQNNIHHIFDKAGHNLDTLVNKCGSKGRALQQITEAATKAFPNSAAGSAPTFPIEVNGVDLMVRGVLINGQFEIGTAFIP